MLTVFTPQRPSKEVVDLLKELSYKFVAKEAGRKGKAEGLAPATMFCLLHLVRVLVTRWREYLIAVLMLPPQPTAKLAAGPFLKELAEEATDPRVRIELEASTSASASASASGSASAPAHSVPLPVKPSPLALYRRNGVLSVTDLVALAWYAPRLARSA